MESHLLKLMANPNITQADCAKVLNVSESRISQIISTESFKKKLQETRLESLEKETNHDNSIQSAEEKALKKLDELTDFITKPIEAARVFQILNSAKRKGLSAEERAASITNNNTVVVLQLPQIVQDKFTVNTNNEVVQIGDRPMLTMDSQLLLNNLMESKNGEGTQRELGEAQAQEALG